MTSPSEFPPPVDSADEFMGPPTDPEDERIEVGVAIVGGGQAGLACAIRLLQLLEDDPELTEALGEVPRGSHAQHAWRSYVPTSFHSQFGQRSSTSQCVAEASSQSTGYTRSRSHSGQMWSSSAGWAPVFVGSSASGSK